MYITNEATTDLTETMKLVQTAPRTLVRLCDPLNALVHLHLSTGDTTTQGATRVHYKRGHDRSD